MGMSLLQLIFAESETAWFNSISKFYYIIRFIAFKYFDKILIPGTMTMYMTTNISFPSYLKYFPVIYIILNILPKHDI